MKIGRPCRNAKADEHMTEAQEAPSQGCPLRASRRWCGDHAALAHVKVGCALTAPPTVSEQPRRDLPPCPQRG